ncbi:MAG TPA: cation diffusion facilitator family transporter [Bacteroidota bacterium]
MHNPLLISDLTSQQNGYSVARQKFAISLSLVIGFLMLAGKTYAYAVTGSAAILSDAAESVVHVFAVAFAAFSLWLSLKPPDTNHPYGHEKVSFFSAGMEGMMIVLAAMYIIYEAVIKWMAGLALQNITTGVYFVAGATVINAVLGGFLVWQGKRHKSLILIANGKHVLTDSWTSFGVILGLLLTLWTGWLPFDPIVAILVALNILWSGGKLVRQSVGGLMDEGDPDLERKLRQILDEETQKRGLWYHELRYRQSGTSLWVEFHLLFPKGSLIEDAHWKATEIEAVITKSFSIPVHFTTHLEPREEHDDIHQKLKAAKE